MLNALAFGIRERECVCMCEEEGKEKEKKKKKGRRELRYFPPISCNLKP